MSSPSASAAGRRFTKMHGLGNDFVVIDARQGGLSLDSTTARLIADRRRGVGCDQLILIEPPRSKAADAFMRILNPDASEAGACGNGTRCVADLLMRESGGRQVVIETVAGLLDAERVGPARVSVDMGAARLDWRDVPLAQACDTAHVDVAVGPLADPACCSMGNPHATFFVPDAEAVDLAGLGPAIEHHRMFPDRVNVGIVQGLAPTGFASGSGSGVRESPRPAAAAPAPRSSTPRGAAYRGAARRSCSTAANSRSSGSPTGTC
jgi:diaminopimelate epimerase